MRGTGSAGTKKKKMASNLGDARPQSYPSPPPETMEIGHDKYRVTVIGSGNWGSVASRLIASNTAKLPDFYSR